MDRTRITGWVAVAGVAAVACEGALLHLRVDETAQTTIPAGSVVEALLGDFGFDGFTDLDVTDNATLQNQGVAPGDIATATVVQFDLVVLDPPDGDLSFLDALEVFVDAPGLDEVRIASLDTFPEGQGTVSMVLDDVDLTEHIVSESLTVTTDARGGRPDQATTLEARFGLRIGVTTQGACNAVRGGGDASGARSAAEAQP